MIPAPATPWTNQSQTQPAQFGGGGMTQQMWDSMPGENTPLNDFTYMASQGGIYGSDSNGGVTQDSLWEVGKFATLMNNPFGTFMSKYASKAKVVGGALALGTAGTAGGFLAKTHVDHQAEVERARANYRTKALEAKMLTSPSYLKLPEEKRQEILGAHQGLQHALVNAAGGDPFFGLYS